MTKIRGYAAWRFLVRFKKGRWRHEPGEIVVLDLGRKATVNDLDIVKGQTEIVDDCLVVHAPNGGWNARARGSILFSLLEYEDSHDGAGVVFTSTVGYPVNAPHRKAICADVAWYTGPLDDPSDTSPPVFAVQVRDLANYSDEAEEFLAIKLADYFAAGTQVVWDVDVLREGVIRVYRASDPENPTIYRRGEIAEAEPAVPDWRFPVDDLWD